MSLDNLPMPWMALVEFWLYVPRRRRSGRDRSAADYHQPVAGDFIKWSSLYWQAICAFARRAWTAEVCHGQIGQCQHR